MLLFHFDIFVAIFIPYREKITIQCSGKSFEMIQICYPTIVFVVVLLVPFSATSKSDSYSSSWNWNFEDEDESKWSIENDLPISRHHFTKKHLMNKRIVFIGDSLSRYQYLNLVHFFHKNSWDLSDHPSVENEKEWNGWKSFHLGTAQRFGCQEFCDCYREDNGDLVMWAKENRHFYDISTNISIDMFLWMPPSYPIRGNSVPTADHFRRLCSDISYSMELMSNYNPASTFSHVDIIDFIRHVIRPLHPDIVIVNQGHWVHHPLRDNATYLNEFVTALRDATPQAIWKTTTARCDDNATRIDSAEFLRSLRTAGLHIFDAYAYTRGAALRNRFEAPRVRVCWDSLHFYGFVYRELNKIFLDFITKELPREAA